jgi:hypothetical protein
MPTARSTPTHLLFRRTHLLFRRVHNAPYWRVKAKIMHYKSWKYLDFRNITQFFYCTNLGLSRHDETPRRVETYAGHTCVYTVAPKGEEWKWGSRISRTSRYIGLCWVRARGSVTSACCLLHCITSLLKNRL